MKHIVLLSLLVISMQVRAQFTINAELKPRFELRHGYKSLPKDDDQAAYFISQRTRLNLNYQHDKYQLGFSLQDVRVWGDEELYSSTGVQGNNASIDLYQAWLWLKLGNNSFVKIGRQEWSYDDQRLLSNRNWNQHGLSYDGILFGTQKNNFQLDLGLSLNNDAENTFGNEYTPDKMKFLDFIYVKNSWSKDSYVSFSGVLSGYQKEEDSETIYVSATFGPYLKFTKNKFLVTGNVFYQAGTNPKGEDINAYMFSLGGDYKFSESMNAGVGLDWLSGENNNKGDNSFDILYGGRHRFFGEMDYFSNLVKSTSDLGLRDFYAKMNYKLNSAHSLNLNYHYFSLQDDLVLTDLTTKDKSLGSEIDLIYRYKASIPVDFRIGLTVFLPTETMEYIQKAEPSGFSYFSYIQLIFTPSLFTSN